jgi:enoyl-CoA hydratase/carnithine racemase
MASPSVSEPCIDRFSQRLAEPIARHEGAPLISRADSMMRIQLNRPLQHNRLDPDDVDALQALFDRIALDREVRAIVFTGAGDRSFSSGYTLDAITSQLDQRFERMLDTLENLPQITLVALNGSVYGGATDLALCCDLRLGTPGLRMFMPAARIGLHYYPGGLRRYVNRLGLSAASKLFLTGMTIESDEMLRIGFLNDIVARDQLLARTEAYLSAIALTDATVVGEMKRHLRSVAERTADYAVLDQAYQRSLGSEELKNRLAALLTRA